MRSEVHKAVTIHLDKHEARVLRKMLGNMSFNSYLNLLSDKSDAEFAQDLGSAIYDLLISEDF